MMAPQMDPVGYANYWLVWQFHRYDYKKWDPEVALAWCQFRPSNCDVLVSLASCGWQPAHTLLCNMAAILTDVGDPLPPWLQRYVVVTARAGPEPARRGQHPLDNLIRDFTISAAVKSIADRFDLRPTRNPANTTKESGCSIVKQALERAGIHMSEANVAAIWQTHNRLDRIDTLRRLRTR